MFKRTQLCLILLSICFLALPGGLKADTFTHKTTGEVFDGFATQKQIRDRTLIFDSTNGDFKPVVLDEYRIEPNDKGRRDNVIVIRITSPEIFLSKTICDEIASTIVEASNKGPRFILIEIDNPGGRGEYSRILAETIKNTNNCPVICYISGGSFSGVYSAAMMVPMACDKVFISSTALTGSISPVVSSATQITDFLEHRDTFSSKRLSLYKDYLVSLAEKKGRNSVAAAAMVDSRIQVVRVQDQGGKKYLIDKADRKGNEVVVDELSKKVPSTSDVTAEEAMLEEDYMLTLTASQTIEAKLADKMVDSEIDVLAEMQAKGANLMIGSSIDQSIRRFQVNRRNAGRLQASMDYLEQRVDELDREIKAVEEINRQAQSTRETQRDEITNSQQRMLDEDDRGYYYEEDDEADGTRRRRPVTGRTSRREVETVTEDILQDTTGLYLDLEAALSDLVGNYQRLIAIGQRYPGAVSERMTLTELENRMNTYQIWFFDIRERNEMRTAEQQPARGPRRPIGM